MQRRLEPVPAEVVVAALEQRDARGPADHGAEQRQIAREQLVLESARAGRNDRAPAGQQHRQQIRERLADARARLDGSVPAGVERLGNERGHLRLRRAIAEALQALGERAVGAEYFLEFEHAFARTIARTSAPDAREMAAESRTSGRTQVLQRTTALNRAKPLAPASSGALSTQRMCV